MELTFLTNFIQKLLGPALAGNALLVECMTGILIFVIVFVVLTVFRGKLVSHIVDFAHKTTGKFDDVLAEYLESLRSPFFVVLAVYLASLPMSLPGVVNKVIYAVFLVAVVIQVVRLAEAVVMYFLTSSLTKKEQHVSAAISITLRVVLWCIGILLVLSNLGFDVTSLIAGLGIGGLAVSLALQNVFQDIFSSFAILIDKPFEEGDYIILDGGSDGTVKKIGLKTTRIQTLQGEELVVSNTELTSAHIRNFKKLKERRVLFHVGVVYNTSVTKLKKVQTLIRKAIRETDNVRIGRVYFKEMADWSLKFEVVYYVKDNEYESYLKAQQEINLGILKAFEGENIHMAFPTQTVHVDQVEGK